MSGLASAGAVVGAGAAAGVFVLAAPAVLRSVGGLALVSKRNKTKLAERKELLLQNALRQHDAILRALKEQSEANAERIEYLTRLKDEAYRDHVFAYVEKEDTPRPLLFQLDLLRETGFAQVEVLHKNVCFAAFGAVKG